MEWRFKEGIPIYQQIISELKLRLLNGTYPPGSRIPAVRELALEAGVNPNTMQRALLELERDDLLASVRTSGRFVTEDEEKLSKLRRTLSESCIEEMTGRLRTLGLTDKEIKDAVNRYLTRGAGEAES
jgi:DNA-binding transcriptional regulator YhcF (GntR family)